VELVDLVREVVEKVGRISSGDYYMWDSQDPDGLVVQLVEAAERVLDAGLLIGRGW
jgi:hypothetical protein